MGRKIAVNKKELDKMLKVNDYEGLLNYISNIRKIIDIVSLNRVNDFINRKVILKEEKNLFHSLIFKNINNKLIEDEQYVLVDESDILNIKSKMEKLKKKRKNRKKKIGV